MRRKLRVVLESPYAGAVERNTRYARACLADSLARGEAPIASHLLYTQEGVLDDALPSQRKLGIDAGHTWLEVADKVVAYTDFGVTPGMEIALDLAATLGMPIEFRLLYEK